MPAHCCRNPFHCIVPPHMLRVLEMRGDPRQTEMARALLSQAAKVRSERSAFTATPMLRTRGDDRRLRGAGLRGNRTRAASRARDP